MEQQTLDKASFSHNVFLKLILLVDVMGSAFHESVRRPSLCTQRGAVSECGHSKEIR